MNGLEKQFEKAGVKLVITDTPFARGQNADKVFGMDIQRNLSRNHRGEYFRIYPGGARVQALGMDKKLGQIVLFVDEPETEFEVRVTKVSIRPGSAQIVRHDGPNHYIVRGRTPGQRRWFLMGVDERQLFIASLPGHAATVFDAHKILKRGDVILAEGKQKGVVRQGEWFFLQTTPAEREKLDAMGKKGLVTRKADIETLKKTKTTKRVNGGNPHVADEVVRAVGEALEHGFGVRDTERYVRGSVRHVDHKTIHFYHWRRVIRNTEPQGAGRMAGVGWVD